VIASQIQTHIRFGGVVPEIASRAHLTSIVPVVDRALSEAAERRRGGCRAADPAGRRDA